MSDEKYVQLTRHGDLTVVHLATNINERDTILKFTDELLEFVANEKPIKLQISFEYVRYFPSEAINALIRTQRRINENDGQMNLCGLNKDLRKLFKLCNLDGTVFQIFDSCREATAAFENGESISVA